MAEAVAEIEEEEDECPKCPPVGAPAWMATFADMATLLMAFFVLILSFAEGTTVISLEFSPSPSPSVTQEMTQQTTEMQKPEIEIDTKKEDSVNGNQQDDFGNDQGKGQSVDGDNTGSAAMLDASELGAALQNAIQDGDVSVEMIGKNVVINFPSPDETQKDFPSLLKETLTALAEARNASGQADSEVLLGGLEQQLKELSMAVNADGQGFGPSKKTEQEEIEEQSVLANATLTEDQLAIALQDEIAQGLVTVERRDGSVFVTVGSGGAFPSGLADLTGAAQDILSRVAYASMTGDSEVTVTGHTDDVPISAGGVYRDNWDLAAARAASVVQSMQSTGLVSANKLKAVSLGETAPVADNGTAAGRDTNRRIEIEISY